MRWWWWCVYLLSQSGLGIEIWTMQEDMEFDEFYIGSSLEEAIDVGEVNWKVKFDAEAEAKAKRERDAAVATYGKGLVASATYYYDQVRECGYCCVSVRVRFEPVPYSAASRHLTSLTCAVLPLFLMPSRSPNLQNEPQPTSSLQSSRHLSESSPGALHLQRVFTRQCMSLDLM